VRPGNVLCPVRDYNSLDHVRRALELTDTAARDLVIMTVHLLRGPDTGYRGLRQERVFSDYEQLLFTRVVALAESAGKPVDLLVVPSSRPFQAIVQAAAQLVSDEIVLGRSAVMSPREQAARLGEAWESLPHKPRHRLRVQILGTEGEVDEFVLGAHPPELTEDDIARIHELWLGLKDELGTASLRHRDVVSLALHRLEFACKGVGAEREAILAEALLLADPKRRPGQTYTGGLRHVATRQPRPRS